MNAPSIRTVAVAAGFCGLSLIVAGTATAMAGGSDAEPIGSSIELTQADGATPTPTPSPTGAALVPGLPIEVGSDPLLECDEAGTCGSEEDTAAAESDAADTGTADTGAVETAVVGEETAASEPAEATADAAGTGDDKDKADGLAGIGAQLADCDLPDKPSLGDDATREERHAAFAAWKDQLVAAAKECGVDLSPGQLANGKGCDRLMDGWKGAREQRDGAHRDSTDKRADAAAASRSVEDDRDGDDEWGEDRGSWGDRDSDEGRSQDRDGWDGGGDRDRDGGAWDGHR
ncbi:hypothetical protein [Demequina sp. NBRC 110057]|uniref:hypothetical protein n=1 Tax=Demequina sp. NBRC 110057 TaxID=1570346 RepID=UPI000A01873C|nr:hypothetical protein [Demequina sp. NBRC 110057]